MPNRSRCRLVQCGRAVQCMQQPVIHARTISTKNPPAVGGWWCNASQDTCAKHYCYPHLSQSFQNVQRVPSPAGGSAELRRAIATLYERPRQGSSSLRFSLYLTNGQALAQLCRRQQPSPFLPLSSSSSSSSKTTASFLHTAVVTLCISLLIRARRFYTTLKHCDTNPENHSRPKCACICLDCEAQQTRRKHVNHGIRKRPARLRR